MAGARLDIVRRGYDLWNRGEMEEFAELLHPEFVYRTSGVFPGFDPVYRGHEGMLRFRATMLEAWETFELHPDELEADGDFVLVALRFVAKGGGSGAEVSLEFHHVQHFRNGLVDLMVAHRDRAAVLNAAGLSE